jgi:hypothetical protein
MGELRHFPSEEYNIPKALNTVYAKPFPIESSHCAVTTRPKAAAKKKLATKTLLVVTPLHSMRLSDRVVSVTAKTPIGSAVCRCQFGSLCCL